MYRIFIVLLLWGHTLFAQEGIADPQKEAVPLPIPVTDVTAKAEEAQSSIQKLRLDLEPGSDSESIEKGIPETLDSLKRMREDKLYDQIDRTEVRVLGSLQQEWTLYYNKLNDWKKSLESQSQDVERTGNIFQEMAAVWKLTRDNALSEKAPRAIRDRISSIIEQLREAESVASKRLNNLLILQNSISENQSEINELIREIKETEQSLRGQLFVRDSPPLWDAFRVEDDSLKIVAQFEQSWNELIRSNSAFVEANQERFYFHFGVLLLLITLMVFLSFKNKREQLFDKDDVALKNSAYFISRPFSAALLIAMFLSVFIYPDRSETVSEFILILLLIPVLRLTPGLLRDKFHKPVFVLAFLFVLDLLHKNAIGFILAQRILLLFASLIGIVVLIWIIRQRGSVDKTKMPFLPRTFWNILPFILFLCLVSLAANFYGSVNLAGTLGWGMVESLYLLVIVYIAASVGSGIITVLIRRRRKRAMQFIRTYANRVEHWAKLVINTIALLIWLRATLRFFAVWNPLLAWYEEIVAYKWTIGTVTISVNAIIDFILIIIGTFILTRFIRIILDMEIFPRIKLPKGLPSAISMMVRYILTILGIFLALSSLGIDIGKFSLLAGALGVGLGFGLQKIVANFISSLILAFGRTIRVGDTVKYNEVFGNVKEIGVNATTVKTFDGSDVLIPNSDLISNSVVNWTLSDVKRRMELPVKVAFDSDPHKVLEILAKVALDHEDVLNEPGPIAVFNGFGDNFLDFTLYYWIPSSLFFKAKTEIALQVYDTIKAKGVLPPRPQRDLRITAEENQGRSKAIERPTPQKGGKNSGLKKGSQNKPT